MDALAAVGLVGNIVQFIDFAGKLVSKTREGYCSADGALVENADLETATVDLLALIDKVPYSDTECGASFNSLCLSCTNIASELLAALDKLKVQGKKNEVEKLQESFAQCVDQGGDTRY
ncbi:hypothetical protein BDZ45DRAFT_225028 [Acephala macrosclerotiorum]|nr:hypothetical protein BDZ45DRAFT_225028 [Acephala macrosclerotiorum]